MRVAPTMRLTCLVLVATVLGASTGRAAPLDTPACDQLRQEIAALEKAGARANLAKGPAAAQAALSAGQIGQVEKLVDTEAQFLFRCPQPKRQFDSATEAVMENGTGSDPDPDAASPQATATKAKASGPAKPDPAAPKPKPKRPTVTAKPKPSDAYVPPAPQPE